MKHTGITLLAAGLSVLLSGCYFTKTGPKFDARARHVAPLTNFANVEATNKIREDWLKPSREAFRLGPGDRLEVEIMGDTASRAITTIGPDGKIYYYLLPGLDVWGLTLAEAKQKIEQSLKEMDILTAPQVSVMLRGIDSTRVWLLGRVANAGVYPMGAPMTLLEALTVAGGASTSSASGTTEDLADLSHSFIVRNGERLPVDFQALLTRGDMSQNIYLQPDDFVYLPSALSKDIYVLGAVRGPKAVSRQHNTLVAAVAESGGPIKNAYLSHVAIVRGTLSNPQIAVVDYQKIVEGRAPDVLLEPRDIVYVPFSPYRFLSKYADLILTTFVRAVAINEGARAVDPNSSAAGVTIGVGQIVQPMPIVPIAR